MSPSLPIPGIVSAKSEAALEPPLDIVVITTRMTKGDEAAYRLFYDQYFNRLLRYLLVITHGREDTARDVLQLTLARIVRYIKPFRSEPVFWSWLTVLARSALIDEERKHQRRLAFLERFFHHQQLGSEPAAPDAEAYLLESLEQSLATLEPADRELIEWKYLSGQSVKEIADHLQVTEKTIESRLGRIRKKLKEAILTQLTHET